MKLNPIVNQILPINKNNLTLNNHNKPFKVILKDSTIMSRAILSLILFVAKILSFSAISFFYNFYFKKKSIFVKVNAQQDRLSFLLRLA
jgi:hypothetical protein